MKTVLILGAGFAGLELATRLSEEVPHDVDVTIIDSNDAFVFGFSKLDVMFGRSDPASVRLPYSMLDKPGVRFVQERILSIDAEHRRVTTDATHYDPDILVVALGADLDPAATPGLGEEASEFYSVSGAEHVRYLLSGFEGGDVVIGVLGNFYKCPAAPYEAALMLHDYLEQRGLRSASTIKVINPMATPIPISLEASAGILTALAERDIGWWPSRRSRLSTPRPGSPRWRMDERPPTTSSWRFPCTAPPGWSRNRTWRMTGGSPSITRRSPPGLRTSSPSGT